MRHQTTSGELRARTPWKHGSARGHDGRLLLSYTEFTPRSARDWLPIALAARRLRVLWPELPGAVGMVLYLHPLHGRGGSLSVWESEQSLHDFVRLPLHVQIMRAYRPRGTVRSVSWWSERLPTISQALGDGLRRLDEHASPGQVDG